ncbi:MAG TPA: isochorismatase family protein [Casimicrobiaceae bacterium]
MPTRNPFLLRFIVTAAAIASCGIAGFAPAQTIIDEWASVQAPPPPTLKPVALDRKTTALLMVDFNQQTCNMERRPRCIASIPRVIPLLAAARAAGMQVVFTLGGGGKPGDLPKELTPGAAEPVFLAGVDKFVNSELEKILRDKGVSTVIVVGTASFGAVLYTASTAAIRGFKVVVPVDGISADIPYAEQYVVWQFANVPVIGPAITLTKLADVKF